MTHYDIFRGQLAIKYPAYGYALWEPSPSKLYDLVEVGDVGFIREGRFHRLFNALLSADHPSHKSGVPEYHEPLIPQLSDHIIHDTLSPGYYYSAGIDMTTLELDIRNVGLVDDCPKTSFLCKSRQGGAVLSLPIPAQRQDTLEREAFGKWMVAHIDQWFAFARQYELGIEKMEELILVTGCDRARSSTNVTFLKNQLDAEVSFGVEVTNGLEGRISWQVSPERIRGSVLNKGPSGKNLPENQCIFIRGFRVARTLGMCHNHLKAAAQVSDTDGDDWDSGPGVELISIPTVPKYPDPLHFIFDYVAKRSPDCDMVLVHDVDLARISEICDSNSLEALQPDVIENHLQDSNAEIHTDLCRVSPVKNDDPQIVRVAMLAHKSNVSPQSPAASLVSETVDLHYPTQCPVMNPQSLKDREDDSDRRGPFVSSQTEMSGHRYSTQNITPYQVISADAHPAPQPISLLDFPPELITRILLDLSPLDIISCRRTCRILYDLCSDSIFRYLIKMERSAVSDDMSPGLSYPERLRMLEKREEAWVTLNFHRSVNIPTPFNRSGGHWSFSGGVLLLGTGLEGEIRRPTVGYSYVILPSLSDAQDQKFEWKRHNFESQVIDIELAVHEHDMIAALTAKEDVYHPYERNRVLELQLLSFSTGQPHPLAEQPVIFIDERNLTVPLNTQSTKIEIVGDFLVLLISFPEWSMNRDMFLLVRWKTGVTHYLASPEKGTYNHFTHLSQDTLVIPNLIHNTFEITKIVIDNDDTPHLVILCVLHLPPLAQDTSLSHICCRSEPKPTGSERLVIPSRSDRPFHDKAEDAIVIFNMSYNHFFRTHMDWFTLIVHRRALLSHIPAAYRACAPFGSAPDATAALVEVPWSIWGPPATRLFMGNPTTMDYTETTAGQRAVMLEGIMPMPVVVRDFNPYAVRAARALASASGQSQQGDWSTLLPNGNRMSLKVEDSVLTAGSIFEEDVWSSLPYVEIVTEGRYQYDGVLMDDERILCFQTDPDGLFTSFIDVYVLG